MKVSENYKLPHNQSELDFVDVDVTGDVRLFIDPRALRDIDSQWARDCVSLLQNFFDNVLSAIISGDTKRAQALMETLSEPNETHLGMSKKKAKGHGMGEKLARDVLSALSKSNAIKSGLLEDLEDTALMVKGVDKDVISDITTNIIRSQLIKYTNDVCDYYGIPQHDRVTSGIMWDVSAEKWRQGLVKLPIAGGKPLLLVPKSIVRRSRLTMDPGEYFGSWILPFMQSEEKGKVNSSLVEVLKNGKRRVTKKSLKIRANVMHDDKSNKEDRKPLRPKKEVIQEFTEQHPGVLDQYRASKDTATPILSHEELATATDSPLPDWDALLKAVVDTPPGKEHEHQYHLAVDALFRAIFHKPLVFLQREYPINGRRKRIDITFSNNARDGFFDWLNRFFLVPTPHVVVECKNYKKDIDNPAIDQIVGRFSDHFGRFGLLCYRGYGDKKLVIDRCRDAAHAGNGYVIALDDADLAELVKERKQNPDDFSYRFLRNRLRDITP